MAKALQRLVDNPDLAKEYGSNARNRFINIFEINNMIDSIEEIYRNIGVSSY
jgi:glycosyltransferase involved in cell wall biosynthesis